MGPGTRCLTVYHINESNTIFYDMSAILLHPGPVGLAEKKLGIQETKLCAHMQDAQIKKITVCVLIHRSELRARLAPLNLFKPSSKIFY